MFTPNELKEIKFDKAVFGGYDIGSVDKSFSAISEDYATIFKENTMLKKKLKLLADTVEDYRSVDEAMRKALITAQNMANEMIAKAEEKSKAMLATAEAEAKAKLTELTALVEAEERKLTDARNETVAFIDNISALFSTENEKLSSLRNVIAPAPAETAAAEAVNMGDTLDQISRSLDEKVRLEEEEIARNTSNDQEEKAEESAEEKAEPASSTEDTISFENSVPTEEEMTALEAAAEEKTHRRHRVEFENLKFGAGYDIKNED